MDLFKWTVTLFCFLLIVRQNNCNMAEESSDLFEGDIYINEDEEDALEHGEAEAGILGAHFRWENGIIPYTISNEFDKSDILTIKGAMKEISDKTCIQFRPRQNEKDYVEYRNGRGCSSAVGRQGNGKQFITLLRKACVNHGTIIHETLHAIGFWHEQSRTDRDKYVDIKWKNIDAEKKHNFHKFTSKTVHDFGVPYDYNSVLHYPAQAFISDDAARVQLQTIVPRLTGVHIGQRRLLSKLDALKVNRMYCSEKTEETTTTEKSTTTSTTTTTTPPTTTRSSFYRSFKSRFFDKQSNENPNPYKSRMWWFKNNFYVHKNGYNQK